MIPLSSPAKDPNRPIIWRAVQNVLDSGRFVLGPETERLERRFCDLTGASYAVAVSSCSDALYIAYRWISRYDNTIYIPALTFVATAESAVRAGMSPLFYDRDPVTDGYHHQVHVPLFGVGSYRCEISDKAQCFPERIESYIECYSFFPAKPLGTTGDGGMLVTNSRSVCEFARTLRNHGSPDRVEHTHVGGNMRMSEINAAVLNVKLDNLDYYKQRLANVDWYRARLPIVGNTYANVVSERPMTSQAFESKRYYTRVVPHHPAYLTPGAWPVSEWFAERLWGIPCGPEITPEQRDVIAREVERCLSPP